MYKETTPENAAGKTFKKLVHSNCGPRVLVVFEDETFFLIEGYLSRDEVELFVENFSLHGFSHRQLVDEGIYSQEEINEYKYRVRVKNEELSLMRKQQLYAELKREFGDQ